jgi:hypothetical protein
MEGAFHNNEMVKTCGCYGLLSVTYGALLTLLAWGLVSSAALGLADTTTLGQTVGGGPTPN